MSQQPYPDEPTWWAWYQAEQRTRYEKAGQSFPSKEESALFNWGQRCAYDICAGMTKEAAAAKHLRDLDQALGLDPVLPPPTLPPSTRLVRPIQGWVRTSGGLWSDDSGLRSLRICSWFSALRHFRDNRTAALAQLDEIALYWQGVRIFWHVWTKHWGYPDYSVDPRWPDFDDLFRDFLRACKARGLVVSLSCGDMQDLVQSGPEDYWHEHIASLAASVDQQVVGWWGVWNEGWQNSAHRPATPSDAARISRKIQALYPWGAHGLSDPEDQEEPAALSAWSQNPAKFTLKHGTRSWPECMNRTFNCAYNEHTGERWPFLIMEDEPTGFGPHVSVSQPDSPRQLFALHSLTLITGQALTFFGGHALKSWTPTEGLDKDWGFRELPQIWAKMNIPEDIATWTIKPGHHGDAAVHPRSYEVPHGEGPHRCDGVQNNTDAWFVSSAGRGTWRLESRWDADFRVWTEARVLKEGRTSAGEEFFTTNASIEGAVVELHAR
jgi:hypothetical protein